ncbi:MAG: FkbM family methyltransferase [Candidatus Korarchaeum sp.]|nr:FkbM family methyltransferase [Candidatus Korarchaeum sp.]
MRVRSFTLDSLLYSLLKVSNVTLIKMDVEWHEQKVLEGARRLLKNEPPRFMIIETKPDSPAIRALEESGYVVTKVLDRWSSTANFVLEYVERS